MMPMPAGDYTGQLEAERDAARRSSTPRSPRRCADGAPVEIERELVEGDAGEALVREAAEPSSSSWARAGARGSGPCFSGRSAGTSIEPRPCPVVVVKAPDD